MSRLLPVIQKNAFADGSYKNLTLQWRSFIAFCLYYGLDWRQPCPRALARYAVFLAGSLKSPKSIAAYIRGVKTLFILLDWNHSHFDSVLVRMALKGVARLFLHQPRRAYPLTPDILFRLFKVLDFSSVPHIVFWALILTGFFTMARKSNLMISDSATDGAIPIKRSHVRHRSGMLVFYFVWSKTNQFGARVHSVPVASIPNSVLCPVLAYARMLQAVPAPPDSLAFIWPVGDSLVPVKYTKFHLLFRTCLAKIGLPSHKFSSHSMRRGGATHAFRMGVPGELIQLLGDWKSDAYKTYLEVSLSQRYKAASSMSAGCSFAPH